MGDGRLYRDPVEAFFARTKRASGGPMIGGVHCLEWQGGKNSAGYGQLAVRKKMTLVHRFAYATFKRPISKSERILHKCDNPACAEVAHLFDGTPADNNADMCRKGRAAFGSRHPGAKLTEADVRAIRGAYAAGGVTQSALSARYGVNIAVINGVVHNRIWRGVEPQPAHLVAAAVSAGRRSSVKRGGRNGASRLTEDAVLAIRAAVSSGHLTVLQAALLHGVSKTTVRRVVRRELWAHV